MDEALTVLVDELPRRLQILREGRANGPYTEDNGPPPEGWDPTDGTLVLVLRSCSAWEHFDDQDRHGVLILGGLAFMEGRHEGIDIGDSDPTYRIEQTCLAFARKDYDHSVFDLDSHLSDKEQRKAEQERARQQIEELARPLLQGHFDEEQIATFVHSTLISLKGFHFPRGLPREEVNDPEDLSSYVASLAAKALEKEAARKLAIAKARAILRDHLDEEQMAEFDETGEFHVLGADGFLYLLTSKLQHNVFRVEDGRRTFEYCIIVKDHVPSHDQMLAQMLLLQSNPSMFHEITNTWLITEDGKRVFQPREKPPEEVAQA